MSAARVSGREQYRGLISLLEVPILNDKYWSKVPEVDCDAIVMDLEDSAPPSAKNAVRERVHRALDDPAFFGGRLPVVRVNNLATPWGSRDLEMVAQHPTRALVCYPKAESAEELAQVMAMLTQHRPDAEIWAMIETTRGLAALDEIARVDGLVGLHFGYTDLAAELAVSAYASDGTALASVLAHAAHRISLAAAAYGLFSTGGTMVPDFRDLAKVEVFTRSWADAGYTACFALSPSHLAVVNKVFSPSQDEAAAARAACAAFERATAGGAANVQIGDRIVTLPEYRRLQALLARCRTR